MVNGVEHREVFIQKLSLVLSKIAYLHVMPQREFTRIIVYLLHDALYQRGLTFTILSYKGNFFPTIDGKVHVVKYHMVTICLSNIFTNYGITATSVTTSEL